MLGLRAWSAAIRLRVRLKFIHLRLTDRLGHAGGLIAAICSTVLLLTKGARVPDVSTFVTVRVFLPFNLLAAHWNNEDPIIDSSERVFTDYLWKLKVGSFRVSK